MTENEWNSCTEPAPMLQFVGNRVSTRKLRLFMVGYCRCNWHLLSDYARDALQVAERLADGEATSEALADAWHGADGNLQLEEYDHHLIDLELDVPGLSREREEMLLNELDYRADRVRAASLVLFATYVNLEHRELVNHFRRLGPSERAAGILRDTTGSTFHEVSLNAVWRTSDVSAVARAIHEERRFGDMPILADALEEAGCTNDEILSHCRNGLDHVRGCWVLDLILSKS